MAIVQETLFRCDYSKDRLSGARPRSDRLELTAALQSRLSKPQYRSERVQAITDVAILFNKYVRARKGCFEVTLLNEISELRLSLTLPAIMFALDDVEILKKIAALSGVTVLLYPDSKKRRDKPDGVIFHVQAPLESDYLFLLNALK